MVDPARYKKSACLLQQKVNTKDAQKKGFRRFTQADLNKVVEQAGDPAATTSDDQRSLREALRDKGVLTYMPWKEGAQRKQRHYLLFHHNSAMAKLVDIIADHGKDNDAKLAKVVTKVKGLWG